MCWRFHVQRTEVPSTKTRIIVFHLNLEPCAKFCRVQSKPGDGSFAASASDQPRVHVHYIFSYQRYILNNIKRCRLPEVRVSPVVSSWWLPLIPTKRLDGEKVLNGGKMKEVTWELTWSSPRYVSYSVPLYVQYTWSRPQKASQLLHPPETEIDLFRASVIRTRSAFFCFFFLS